MPADHLGEPTPICRQVEPPSDTEIKKPNDLRNEVAGAGGVVREVERYARPGGLERVLLRFLAESQMLLDALRAQPRGDLAGGGSRRLEL